MLLAICLFFIGLTHPANAAMRGSQSEAYEACMEFAKDRYEERIRGSDARMYKCVRQGNSYVGAIWLRNCLDSWCNHYWSIGYGREEWPQEVFDRARNLGPSCQGSPRCQTDVGNPINVGTGNKFEVVNDIEVPGLLAFQRTYNSQGLSAQVNPLGPAWTHSFSSRVEYSEGATTAKVHRPDGGYSLFVARSDGAWAADSGSADSLAQSKGVGDVTVGWMYRPATRSTFEVYDQRGRLVHLSDRSGDWIDLDYGDAGTQLENLITRVSSRSGRALQFSYDTVGRITTIVAPDGGVYGYSFSDTGMLSKVQYPGGHVKEYRYGEVEFTSSVSLPIALTGVIDEMGARFATFQYDSAGRAVQSEHAGGVDKYRASYNTSTNVSLMDPMGNNQYRTYTSNFGVRTIASYGDRCGGCPSAVISYSYDVAGNLDKVKDRRGIVTDHDLNAWGGETRRIDAVGKPYQRTTEIDFDAELRVPVERRLFDAAGALRSKVSWLLNARGQVLAETRFDPSSSESRTSLSNFCEQQDIDLGVCPQLGLVISTKGPRSDVDDITSFKYYSDDDPGCLTSGVCAWRKGDLRSIVNALGQSTDFLGYDGAGRLLSLRDPNGVLTDLEYGPRGWIVSAKVRGPDNGTEVDDSITRITYQPTGLIDTTILPDGSSTTFKYDLAQRLTAVVDSFGNSIQYTLDSAGRRTREVTKDADGVLKRTLTRVYNQLGQLQKELDSRGNAKKFSYDVSGSADLSTDALGRVMDHDYDPLGRLVKTTQAAGSSPSSSTFEYDAQDNILAVTDPRGLTTRYLYNGFGDLIQLVSPDTGVATYQYDSAGNRVGVVDARGGRKSNRYDALNRLTSVSYGDAAQNLAYTYDVVDPSCGPGGSFSVGRLSRMEDGSGITRYCYDRFGNVTRKEQVAGGISLSIKYGYNKIGRVDSITYPDGMMVDYVRDMGGRVREVGVELKGGTRQTLLTGAKQHAFGPSAGWTFGSGRKMSRNVDGDYRPKEIISEVAGGLNLGFNWDAVGNLIGLSDAGGPAPLQVAFEYDQFDRLINFRDALTKVAIESYAYDVAGNRVQFADGAGPQNYDYPLDSHRLTSVGGIKRNYDPVGNTTNIGDLREFQYNSANRTSVVKYAGNVAASYLYNGKGERVRQQRGTSSVTTIYDEEGRWLGDFDENGVSKQLAAWFEGMPVGLVSNGHLNYVEPDHLGTPRVVIDPRRDVAVWRWDPAGEAFGNSLPNQDPDNDLEEFVFDLRFPGHRYDEVSVSHYNYFRDYDPTSGRYLQSDRIGLAGGQNTYVYSENTPLVAFDPDGLKAVRDPPQALGTRYPDGTVYCEDGEVTPFVNWSRLSTYERECVGDCLYVHENIHVRDAVRSSPGVCRYRGWIPFIHPLGVVTFDSVDERLASEYAAHMAELRCLREKITEGGCASDTCRKVIEKRVSDIINVMLPRIRARTYPDGV